ncbi:G2/mitotic-specific cyclin cdc13 [Ceratobasidium sp. AG-Ba]|nr:G2/mitotic-specific cyclin cdc13 [Ceratobasidium sp. AG-Ba]
MEPPARGAAIQTKKNQASIDAVITINLGPTSDAISRQTTSAIYTQVKNRKQRERLHVNRPIAVRDHSEPTFSSSERPKQIAPISITEKIRNLSGAEKTPTMGSSSTTAAWTSLSQSETIFNATTSVF